MRVFLSISIALLISISINAQSCSEFMQYVKSKGYGTTYNSFNSDAISRVTFYQITVDYQTMYFAIVCFKQQYSVNCTEYIYQVGSTTKFNYAINYLNSAGKAFWEHIQPYNRNLGCGPNF